MTEANEEANINKHNSQLEEPEAKTEKLDEKLFGSRKTSESCEQVTLTKDYENLEKEILHSLITLLMKVGKIIYFYFVKNFK